MSCFSEETYSIYIDDELSQRETREVETHLVRCQNCRAQVLALREEASLLGDVLLERSRAPAPRHARAPAPVRGLAIGLIPSLALLGLLAAVVGWLLELHSPASVGWLNPLNPMGALEMLFNLIFWLRDQAPDLFELALAVAATAGVSAVLSFAVSSLFRRLGGPTTLVLALALIGSWATPVFALELAYTEDFQVASGEKIDESLVVSGERVRIDGVISGDLFVLAERLALRGEVQGNLFALVREFEMSGVVTGSLHVISESAVIEGETRRDVYALCEHFRFARPARVGRDLSVMTPGVEIQGAVGRDLVVWGKWTELRGSVGRTLRARHKLALLDGARVGGDVVLGAHPGSEIEIAESAVVGGEARNESHEHHMARSVDHYRKGHFYLWVAVLVSGTFLVGMVLHLFMPGLYDVQLATSSEFFRSLGVGFLTFLAVPCVLLISALTVIGIPLALMGLWLYLTTLYVAFIVLASLIGAAITRSRSKTLHSFGLALLVGLLVVILAITVPYVGGLVRVVVLLCGLGLLTERAVAAWRAARA